MSVESFNVLSLSKKLEAREITSKKIVEELFSHIDKVEKDINAINHLDREKILGQALQSDERREKKATLSPFDGIPIAIKDNICVKGESVECSSSILNGYRSVYDATVIKNLKEKGFILFGRTNMDEFAMGSTTATSQKKKTVNPHNFSKVPGGSSGGSAAGVASNEFIAALGTDTGGSIRQPAAFCGTVGYKPTYGRVSRYGLVAFASSLDQIGVLTKSTEDAALLADVLIKKDKMDSTSLENKEEFFNGIEDLDIKSLTIGVPKQYFDEEEIQREVKEKIEKSIELYQSLGAKIIKVSLPHTKYAIPTYYVLATAEASSNLARFDGVRYGRRAKLSNNDKILDLYQKSRSEGFGNEVQRRILLGTFVLSSGYSSKYYHNALKARNLIKKDFDEVFKDCDILLTPVTPTTAFSFDEKKSPVDLYLSDILTSAANIVGLPGISIPCGFDDEKMPIGMQLLAPKMEDKLLLQTARFFEKNTKG